METEKAVLVSEAQPSPSTVPEEARFFCRVCQRQFSKYTCPRCNTRYCSLDCYKGHSLRCTESFMRDNVMAELRQVRPDDDTRKRMLDILKRFHAQQTEQGGGGDEVEDMNADDDHDDDDSVLSEDLSQKVLSGGEIRLEDLSPDEARQFQRAVASGELSRMIEPWNPWWKQPSAKAISLSPDGTQLIKPIQAEEESSFTEIPAGAEIPIPPLSHLSSANPSPLLTVHLVDVIYSYCFTLRLYNGDWQCDPLGAATELLNMSATLGDDARPETVSEALVGCLEKTCSPVYKHTGGYKFGIGLIDDVISVLFLGGNALICLLCDIQRLVKAGARALKSWRTGKERNKAESGRRFKNAERKAYFLMCWVHEQPGEAWSSLASILEVEKASVVSTRQGSKQCVGEAEGNPSRPNKRLIEEV